MVTPSRNAPCPCGSGLKYKACCLPRERQAGPPAEAGAGRPSSGRADRRVARAAAEHPWEAGIFPLTVRVGDHPDDRVGVAMVAAGGLILHSELVAGALGRPDEVVDAHEAALDAAAGRVGVEPDVVHVRGYELARLLAFRLAVRGVEVEERPRMPGLERAARALNRDRFHTDALPVAATAPTWRAWGLSAARCRALFAAAARFRRAAPWDWLEDADGIRTFAPAGLGLWAVSVMGAEGQEEGLVVYTDSRDFAAVAGADASSGEWMEGLHGAMITLTFESRGALTRDMQKEVAAAGWEVADPDGYPMIFTVSAPAGGLDPVIVDVLTGILVAVPDFVDALDDEFEDTLAGETIRWIHEPTGLQFLYDVPGGFEWPVPDRLEPGCATGPGAEPAAVLPEPEGPEDVHPELDVIDAFAARLRDELAEATATRHARNAADLVRLVNGRHGAPLRALHELDLRTFLYDDFPRLRPGYTRTDSLPASIRRFLAFLAEREGIELPWAEPILADKDALARRVARAPAGPWWNPEVVAFRADLADDLERRAMLLPDDWGGLLGDTLTFGPEEHRLRRVAQRLWLAWRDELILAGTDRSAPLHDALAARLQDWVAQPDPDDADGRTRLEVVKADRARTPPEEQERMLRALMGRDD
jgi:hypothetical protein